MKTMVRSLCLWVVVGLLTNCHPSRDPTLQEAARVHRDAERLAGQLKTKLAGDEHIDPDSIRVWMNALAQWERELMEIPGEGGHEHHNHHHTHQPSADLTSDQVLAIQLEMKKQLEDLQKRVHDGSHP